MVETRSDLSGIISEAVGYNKRHNWRIVGQKGAHIRLSFTEFKFEFHLDCAHDYLEVFMIHSIYALKIFLYV